MDQTNPSSPTLLPSLSSRRTGLPRPLPPAKIEPQSSSVSASPTGSAKRRRSEYDADDDSRPSPGNKKACDQCKQHKQKCDIGQNEDGSSKDRCERCVRNSRGCSFTDGFKRTAKRDEHVARENEVMDLKVKLVELEGILAEKDTKISELETACEYLRLNGSINANSGTNGHTSFGPASAAPPSTPRATSSISTNFSIGIPPPSSIPTTNSHGLPYTTGYTSLPTSSPYQNNEPTVYIHPQNVSMPFNGDIGASSYDAGIAPNEADASHSLIRLSQRAHPELSSKNRRNQTQKSIEDVRIPPVEIHELFSRYWREFHPYLPLLDPKREPNDYYKDCPMLFWTVVFVASRHDEENSQRMKELRQPVMQLIYTTLSQNSQSYNIVKGLCLICTWPPHTKSTSTDPTFDLAGVMMAMAMRLGLHRPSHARDFAKDNLVVAPTEVQDRLRTWAACNIVAETVSTGYGQPSLAQFDYILGIEKGAGGEEAPLPSEFRARLKIEILVQKISTYLYRGPTEDDNRQWEDNRHNLTRIFDVELGNLSFEYIDSMTPSDRIYLKAASLHLHLSVLFATCTSEDYLMNLRNLYTAAIDFIDHATSIPLSNAPNYIMQMLLAAGFTILKLLNGFFAYYMDTKRSKSLLATCVRALREISVASNDLPCRLAEVLAQMSKASPLVKRISLSLSSPSAHSFDGHQRLELETGIAPAVDDSLKLLVKYRRSMSIVYDSVWSWRERFQGKGAGGNLDEAVRRPTDPESGLQTPVPVMGTHGEEVDFFSGLDGFEDFGAFDQTFDPLVGLPDVM